MLAQSVRPLSLMALLALAALQVSASAAPAGQIVDHPDKLKFEELDYTPPKPGDYRHTLKCGATAYVAENPEVPTFQLTHPRPHRLACTSPWTRPASPT